MVKYFFTYGTSGFPFTGGWTIVEAPNRAVAIAAFRKVHPDRHEGILNCSSVYSESRFALTSMGKLGNNLGRGCHEILKAKEILKGEQSHD